jgi:DTW domain-containing protein YfiP
MHRVYCEGCGRPPIVCICAALVTVVPRTKVVVLQHPREADNAIGTAWMVERCFGAERIVGVELENDPRFARALSDPAAPAILLAPGPSAIDLHARPPEGPVTLIVVDGTWSQAKKLFRVNPSLARLPRYAFQPASPSNYRIRREPADHCVSTIEATVAALALLEERRGSTVDVHEPLRAFEAMVDHQIRIARERAESRHLRSAIARNANGARPARRRKMPLVGRELVVLYGEANAWPRGTEHGAHPEVVHVVAERVSTGERFEAFVAPERPLSPGFVFHTHVPEERVLGGESRARFHARLAAFLREGDELAIWGFYVIELLRREGMTLPACVDLRTTAIRFLGRPAGDAAQMATALGCEVDEPWAIGRTGLRHAAAISVARALSRREPIVLNRAS